MAIETNIMKKIISTNNAPAAIGPYSQAVLSGDTLYCSGQIAINPKNGELKTNNIEEETTQVMNNISAILIEANMAFSDIVKCTIYMRDMQQYGTINKIYSLFFNGNPPAREAVEVSMLPKNVNVEISIIAKK